MELGVFRVFVGASVLVFLGGVEVGFSQSEAYARNYISWDDLKVDEPKVGLNSRNEFVNGSRVIVVDKNGGGDSLTVQGAVDMVPEQNTDRVKIYILPGIYRSENSESKLFLELLSVKLLTMLDCLCASRQQNLKEFSGLAAFDSF